MSQTQKKFLFIRYSRIQLFICPIAIACSMGQIIKSVCVCQSVCVSVCEHSHSIFTKIGTDVIPPKVKTSILGSVSSISHHPFPFCPSFKNILGREVLKIYANIKQSYICLKFTRSLKFLRLIENLGRGTRRWRQIWDRKWKYMYGRLAHAQWKICNMNIFIHQEIR